MNRGDLTQVCMKHDLRVNPSDLYCICGSGVTNKIEQVEAAVIDAMIAKLARRWAIKIVEPQDAPDGLGLIILPHVTHTYYGTGQLIGELSYLLELA